MAARGNNFKRKAPTNILEQSLYKSEQSDYCVIPSSDLQMQSVARTRSCWTQTTHSQRGSPRHGLCRASGILLDNKIPDDRLELIDSSTPVYPEAPQV